MGIKTLLVMKDPAISQLKELSQCGTSDCSGIKGLEMAEEVTVDRGSDVSKVLEVKNTCPKFKQFL
jgi:hypothetical protein